MPFKKLSPEEMKQKNRPQNVKPIWKLERDGLTQGSIAKFMDCREQFRLGIEEGWSAKGESTPMAFGSAFHHVLAEVHTQVAKTPKLSIARYKKKQEREGLRLTSKEAEDRELLLAQVEIVADAYLIYWAKHDEQKKWVAREVAFNHLQFLDTRDNGAITSIPLRGRWDGLYEGPRGKLWLHETKTKTTVDEDGIRLSLPFDLQTMLYSYVAQKVYGRSVGGVLYDVIRRPGLKQGKTESLKGFLDRIKLEIAKNPAHYFYRWENVLAKDDISNWEANQFRPILADIVRWNFDRSNHYMRPGALTTAWGSRCDLFYAITQGNYHGLYRRKHVYPELID